MPCAANRSEGRNVARQRNTAKLRLFGRCADELEPDCHQLARFIGFPPKSLEARVGIEPTHKGFADLSLTTWVPRLGRAVLLCIAPYRRSQPGWRRRAIWSGRRDLNSRPSPWQGDALPLSYSRFYADLSIPGHQKLVKPQRKHRLRPFFVPERRLILPRCARFLRRACRGCVRQSLPLRDYA